MAKIKAADYQHTVAFEDGSGYWCVYDHDGDEVDAYEHEDEARETAAEMTADALEAAQADEDYNEEAELLERLTDHMSSLDLAALRALARRLKV